MYRVIAKQCVNCRLIKQLNEFSKTKNGKFGKKSTCKQCDHIAGAIYREKRKNEEKWITIFKKCITCGKLKFQNEYYNDFKSIDSLTNKCIDCIKIQKHKYYLDHKEYIDLKNRQWALNNPDKYETACIKYREKNKEKLYKYKYQWYLDHKYECNLRSHNWYINNKERMLKLQREYNQINHEHIKHRKHEYYLNHKEEICRKDVLYRIRRKDYLNICHRKWRIANPDNIRRYTSNRKNYGFNPINIQFETSHAHHLWLSEASDMVIYIPSFIHDMYYHNHNKSETMITINCIALDYWIHEELYRILFFEDIIKDKLTINALDSEVISFIELSNMMYESRRLSTTKVPPESNTQEVS